ncbi:MAG: GNAT family N-acetyltransferase [Candidatus Staskawiczbacteria bacterium]|nr:GNAT family N-acetyltransferase [Candidatus Staskawiczbacteria bacterium]
MVEIKLIKKVKKSELVDINNLISQMSLTSTSPKPMTMAVCQEMLSQKNLFFLVAVGKIDGQQKIIGILSIYFIRIPTGLVAWSEDLVIDTAYRGWGLGRLLMEASIKLAYKKRSRHLNLRTNPQRIEANKLYQLLGFKRLNSNFYRINMFK